MCCSCGNKRGTSESKKFYCELVVDVAAPSDLVGSFLVEILHSVEGGDVEKGYSNLETNLPCLRLLSLYLSLVFISCMLLLFIFITSLIYLCLIVICLGLFAHTCIQPREL